MFEEFCVAIWMPLPPESAISAENAVGEKNGFGICRSPGIRDRNLEDWREVKNGMSGGSDMEDQDSSLSSTAH